jgi:hypothetical protein
MTTLTIFAYKRRWFASVNTIRYAENRKIMSYRAEGNVCCEDKQDCKNESR